MRRNHPPALLSLEDQKGMHRAGRAAAETLAFVGARLRPGMRTSDIDALVREDTARRGAIPCQLGYEGFPASVCTSVNEVVCHGIPSEAVVLREGDIVNVDVTSELDGYCGDTSATFAIGAIDGASSHLIAAARACRDAGIAVVRHGARLGDIGAAIEACAKEHGVSVVREYGGHGIGRRMHQPPHISHVGQRGTGMRLVSGMAITIEPMVNLGSAKVRTLSDGWTVVTWDGLRSAQFEHTLLVGPDGAEPTTRLPIGYTGGS